MTLHVLEATHSLVAYLSLCGVRNVPRIADGAFCDTSRLPHGIDPEAEVVQVVQAARAHVARFMREAVIPSRSHISRRLPIRRNQAKTCD